nr:aminoacyl-tRNA synthetase, class 1a, anticodon-binding [Tanacetum cinerariifolium]
MHILSVVRLTIDNQFGYGYLKEIVVRRANLKEYLFREAEFSRLHLNDIEDLLLLYVQQKIHNLTSDKIVHLVNSQKHHHSEEGRRCVACWEMVPFPLGSIHAYYDMEGHTKHFTSLRELLHMVEKNDLRKLLGVVDNLYQREEPDTFALIFWGDLCVHVLETVDGRVIYMFLDVSYPLSAATLTRMLTHGLEVPKLVVGGDLTMAEQLVCFIKAALLDAQSAV